MRKSSLSFLFALVFCLLGAAHRINSALYTSNKLFISWLLIDLRTDSQWDFPILFWAIAGGFLIFGIQSETTRKTWIHSPAIRVLPRIIVLGACFVFIGYLCLNACVPRTFSAHPVLSEDSLSYQGHVYLLSVEDRGDEMFNFEVSQCDASGWFCHVIYDASRHVDWDDPPFSNGDLVEAHLQADAPHHYLFILYHGKFTSDREKLICPIPPS